MFDRHFKVWPAHAPHGLELPNQTLTANLAITASRFPTRTATIYHGRSLTYADLHDRVARLAGFLQQRAGVAKGDRVLLFMQNSPQFIVGYYAILRADAVVVPVNPMNRTAELEHIIGDTGADVGLVGQELLGEVTPLLSPRKTVSAEQSSQGASEAQASGPRLACVVAAAYAEAADPDFDLKLPNPLDQPAPADYGIVGVVRWADALDSGLTAGPPQASSDDLAVIPYSSGTTGHPKGCMHTHRTVMATLVGGIAWNPMDETSISLVSLPLFHVTGMQNSMNGPIYVGGSMVIMTRWDRAAAADLIRRYRVTRWRSISTMAIDLVNDPDAESYDLCSLEMIGGGGAAMPDAIAARLKTLTGLDYIEGYGMSETIAATHINPIDRPRRQCLGIPIFEVDCRVLDLQDGRELGPDAPGEIVINAPQVMKGYWNNPSATRAAFVEIDGKLFLRTGDIAYYDKDGYFFMVDRVKRMINVSGYKVWPTEVEALMHRHPAISEVCVIAASDRRRGESVKAVVVLRDDAKGAIDAEAIKQWCRGLMSAYKCPRVVEFVDRLPRSATGKLQWKILQEQERAGGARAIQ
ncbi:long-chain-fatty-acid--CoA ligase [Algihabitans albus]|uniref:long-chain-fatty-acid--CoA ligase n=1 Tax=Algihabitans albus TaxID=2164067 RepID=UPI000E5D3845|nr:long-chain-fatty-acid--CoA ligase [Algihabitans albus]